MGNRMNCRESISGRSISVATKNQGCLAVVLKLFGITFPDSDSSGVSQTADAPLPYRLQDDFLSAAELSFFHVLRHVIGDRFVVTTKVRVADLLYVVQRSKNSLCQQDRPETR